MNKRRRHKAKVAARRAKHWRAIGGESGVIRWIDAEWIANARAYLRDVECYAKAVIVQYEESMARRAAIGWAR